MGGGAKPSCCLSSSPDDHSFLDDDNLHSSSDGLGLEFAEESVITSGFDSGELDQMGCHGISSDHVPMAANFRILSDITNSYINSVARIESLHEAKRLILSYTPGSWIDKEEGENLSDFDVPKTTTLLVIGFKGSGKSSLINRISRVFEDEKLAADRAQVSSDCLSSRAGTYFLQRYMIPRRSASSFCLFDTRSLSDELHDNYDLIKSWMTNGVRHGELVIRESDHSSLRNTLKCKIRDGNALAEPIRKVNFIIFVVDGLSVLRYMNSHKEEMLARTYNFPYLSFRDDKPVIVVTRGDLLSYKERARIRIYLGKLLGVPPATQIFDIPESCDGVTELAVLQMLKYALEHADKNLPRKSWACKNLLPAKSSLAKVFKSYFMALIFLGLALGVNVAMEGRLPLTHRDPWTKSPVHLEPLVNPNLEHPAQPQFSSSTQPTSSCNHREHTETTRGANQTVKIDLSNSSRQPKSSQHPETTRETNQTLNQVLLNSTTQSNSSHSAGNAPCQNPKVQSKPSQRKVTDKPCKRSVRSKTEFSKHKSRAHSKQQKAAVSEPTISWEARQRLWLVEE